MKHISLPLEPNVAQSLRAGDEVLLSGPVFTARDATHLLILDELHKSGELPYGLNGQVIMYAGPTPARGNRPLGSVGPTTSKRMDRASLELLRAGLAGTFGKGDRSPELVEVVKETGSVYFAAIGGIAALLAEHVRASEVIAYPELGPEALIRLELDEFPAFVALDSHGEDYYALGPAQWRAKLDADAHEAEATSAETKTPADEEETPATEIKKRGVFISFEGGEGAGKSTQINALARHLEQQGLRVLMVREPGDTLISEQIRSILLHSKDEAISPRAELLLYEAARAQLIEERIEPALAEGITVIADRFFDSSTAYQGYGRGLEVELIKKLNLFASKGLCPDRTIFLAAGPEVGLKRASSVSEPDRLERAGLAFHSRVQEGFEAIACEEPDRVRLVRADRAIVEVFADVLAELADLFPDLELG